MLEIQNLSKIFGSLRAVNEVSLQIRDGEFFALLGPSGCGKTTLLRTLAGFETPTEGQILLGDKRIDGLPANRRSINLVFQRYALFPHMNVRENVEFGLRMKGVSRQESRVRVDEMLALVRMQGFESRLVTTLSGGQQQRIALARALVNQPRVLLLDEPLSALDLQLRQQMQVELRGIQKRIGHTFILVTHDQEEALTLSDRIAVMDEGRIEQVGTPEEIYDRPITPFVAGFIGSVNAWKGRVEGSSVRVSDRLVFPLPRDAEGRFAQGAPVSLYLRPEKIRFESSNVRLQGKVREALYQGAVTRFVIESDEFPENPIFVCHSHRDARAGENVGLTWTAEDCRVLPA